MYKRQSHHSTIPLRTGEIVTLGELGFPVCRASNPNCLHIGEVSGVIITDTGESVVHEEIKIRSIKIIFFIPQLKLIPYSLQRFF